MNKHSDFYNGIEWFACWLLDHTEGETISEEQLRPWAIKAWEARPKNQPPTHITFEPLTPNPATQRWAVMSKDQRVQIGTVSWHGPWRKYCFFPAAQTVFEQVCLRDIARFCETETAAQRAAKSSIGNPQS